MNPWHSIESLSHQEIVALQEKKLHQFITQQLYPFSPYYQNLFKQHRIDPHSIKTLKDLSRIPLTSKADFINSADQPDKFRQFILQPTPASIRQSWPLTKKIALVIQKLFSGQEAVLATLAKEYRPNFMTFTTGTTKTPVAFVYSQHDIHNLNLSGSRMLKLFDIKPDEKVVNIFPFAPHLAFWQVVFGGLDSSVLILSTGGGKVIGTEGNIQAILKMRPSVLLGVPSYIYHLLRLAKEKKCDLSFLKKIILGASAVTNPFKLKLNKLLQEMGAKDTFIFGTYGFTESRCAWAECPSAEGTSSGYHLYPDKEIFEIIDPQTGEVKKEGEDGEIVYTSLDSRGSSVLRFRTGDFVTGGIVSSPCPYCRRSVPRLSNNISRISETKDLQLSKVKGSLINLSLLTSILNDFDFIVEWQIELRKKDNDPDEIDELVIFVAAKSQEERQQQIWSHQIKQEITVSTEVSPNAVIFLSLEEIVKRLELETASKEKRIIDRRVKV